MSAVAVLQTAWNCRWSRAGHRIAGLAEAAQPESLWVCTYDGARRSVSDEACAHCATWEPLATAAAAPLTVVGASRGDRRGDGEVQARESPNFSIR
jgi:hypothetical protein